MMLLTALSPLSTPGASRRHNRDVQGNLSGLGEESLVVRGRGGVVPADRATVRRWAGQGADGRGPALVQGSQSGQRDRRAPAAVVLAGHESLAVAGGGGVVETRARADGRR